MTRSRREILILTYTLSISTYHGERQRRPWAGRPGRIMLPGDIRSRARPRGGSARTQAHRHRPLSALHDPSRFQILVAAGPFSTVRFFPPLSITQSDGKPPGLCRISVTHHMEICVPEGGLVKKGGDSVRARPFEDKNTTTLVSRISVHGRCSQVVWLQTSCSSLPRWLPRGGRAAGRLKKLTPPLHLQTSRFSLGRLVHAVSTVPVSFPPILVIYSSFPSILELMDDPVSL